MIELPRLMFGREQDVLHRLSALKADGFQSAVCENIAHIALAKQCGMKLFGGAFLNCTNSQSAQWLSDQGLSSLTLSFEMRAQDISRMKTVVPRGVIACGHLPLMLWRNCPAKGEKSCAGCTRRCALTDRYGKSFPILCMRPFGSAMLNGDMLWTADKTADFRPYFLCHLLFYNGIRENVQRSAFTTESGSEACWRVYPRPLLPLNIIRIRERNR